MTNPNAGTRGTSDIKTDYPDKPEDIVDVDRLIPETANNTSRKEDVGLEV